MSVKFTPGPHPTSLSRSTSSKIFLNHTPTPNPSLPNSPITITFPSCNNSSIIDSTYNPERNNRSNGNMNMNRERERDLEDPERQPLISTRELNRKRYFWSIITTILVIILLGLFIGFGGWNLGRGTGGGKWPGSPGI
ncbi:uncharacterized protein L201_007666 [Kwoniella dendrophila CBS 6074]|uniref:Uncharacterized protein n=1 Tax=Kwoniella dendrophila CBS 6074 TaxID=1295534 RepID=A0AAX4K568_9TREE